MRSSAVTDGTPQHQPCGESKREFKRGEWGGRRQGAGRPPSDPDKRAVWAARRGKAPVQVALPVLVVGARCFCPRCGGEVAPIVDGGGHDAERGGA